MGTDIHPVIEIRRNGKWAVHPGEERPYRYYNPEHGDKRWNPRTKVGYIDVLGNRDYLKFAILADVRNGYGFAGIETFTPLVPISSQRGLPEDTAVVPSHDYDEDTDEYVNGQDLGDHSMTWVTLAELLAYDFGQTLARTGVLSEGEFLACLIEKRNPHSWSGDISGGGIVTLRPDEYLALFGEQDYFGQPRPGTRTYDCGRRYVIRYDWDESLAGATKHWREPLVEYLTSLVPEGGTPDDVRLVMGFDS